MDPTFRTTRWSVVRAARDEDSAVARDALATLCETYWYPLYAFVRRLGNDREAAEDLTQGFFARLLDKRDLGSAEPERGRFRAYLLASVKHFISNERDRERAVKRGGGKAPLPIDYADADRRYLLEPDRLSPERVYLRNWALEVVARASGRLEEEYAKRNDLTLFRRLRPCLTGGEVGASRREIGEELGLSETAVNVAVHRLRRRFRDCLRAEVAHTVTSSEDVDGELRALHEALGQ